MCVELLARLENLEKWKNGKMEKWKNVITARVGHM
jgi:hypothetical protein